MVHDTKPASKSRFFDNLSDSYTFINMKAGILSSLLTIVSLASAAAIEPQPEINTNRTFVPTPNGIATADTSSSGPTDHIAWWFAPSGSHITDFSVDMEVPALSPHPKVGVSR